MSDSPYDVFAKFYDRHWGDFFLEDAKDGIAQFFLPLVPHGGRVLDLCCGTGQTAAWLAACSFEVVALDASAEMLKYVRLNAPHAERVRADAREFELDRPVDAVLSTFDSINHLETLRDVQAVFRQVFRALRPGGWFLFDINTVEGFEYAADQNYSLAEDDHALIVLSRFDAERGIGVSDVTIFEDAGGGSWRRSDCSIPEYLHEPEDVAAALREVGFLSIQALDATEDFEMPKAEGRIFLLAQRPE